MLKVFGQFKSDDFGLEDKNVLGGQNSLKVRNWKLYSVQIIAKHNISQNFWDSSGIHLKIFKAAGWIHSKARKSGAM